MVLSRGNTELAKRHELLPTSQTLSLGVMMKPEPRLVRKAAYTLEVAYRNEIKSDGFPNMEGVQTKVVSTTTVRILCMCRARKRPITSA